MDVYEEVAEHNIVKNGFKKIISTVSEKSNIQRGYVSLIFQWDEVKMLSGTLAVPKMKNGFEFPPRKGRGHDRGHSHAMTCPYFAKKYNFMHHEVMGTAKKKVV